MIQLNKVTTGYHEDNPLLKNYTKEFADNQIYGILGRSGCGKTTLLRTICGLLAPLDGEILLDSKPISKPYKNNIYMMHQGYTCFDWKTVIDNVLIAKKVKGRVTSEDVDKAHDWIRRVHLDGHEKKYPTQLSGGMRQRLALARTLFMSPKVILMDEPLSALDEDLRAEMQELILSTHADVGNTIILITHSRAEASRLCDEVINLNQLNEEVEK